MSMRLKIRKEFQEMLPTTQFENCSLLEILFLEHLFCLGVEYDFSVPDTLRCISKQRTKGDGVEAGGEQEELHNNNLLIIFLRSWCGG